MQAQNHPHTGCDKYEGFPDTGTAAPFVFTPQSSYEIIDVTARALANTNQERLNRYQARLEALEARAAKEIENDSWQDRINTAEEQAGALAITNEMLRKEIEKSRKLSEEYMRAAINAEKKVIELGDLLEREPLQMCVSGAARALCDAVYGDKDGRTNFRFGELDVLADALKDALDALDKVVTQ
jgi:hypothetical protein